MVERCAENAGVGSPILPLGTILLRSKLFSFERSRNIPYEALSEISGLKGEVGIFMSTC